MARLRRGVVRAGVESEVGGMVRTEIPESRIEHVSREYRAGLLRDPVVIRREKSCDLRNGHPGKVLKTLNVAFYSWSEIPVSVVRFRPSAPSLSRIPPAAVTARRDLSF